jgi:hypothetical protein
VEWEERIGGLLREPAASAEPVPSRGAPSTRAAIGSYRLLEKIGEGSMAEVWRAGRPCRYTAPVHRTVAIKLIKAGMETKATIARFESEWQALALMDHPAIVRVFNAGATAEGRPYFGILRQVPPVHAGAAGAFPAGVRGGANARENTNEGLWWNGPEWCSIESIPNRTTPATSLCARTFCGCRQTNAGYAAVPDPPIVRVARFCHAISKPVRRSAGFFTVARRSPWRNLERHDANVVLTAPGINVLVEIDPPAARRGHRPTRQG